MLRISAENKQVKLRKQLGKLIQSCQLGDRLPSEPALAKRYGVSRSTLRDVLTQLETEGFITRRQGSGTYVSRMPIEQDESLVYFMDFSTLIAKQGYTPNVHQLSFIKQKAGTFFSSRLDISENDKVVTRRCLYTADDHFCVLAEDTFPLSFITSGQFNFLLRSEYTDIAADQYYLTGRTTYRDETTLTIVYPWEHPFLMTLISEDRPLLLMSSIGFDKQNKPFTCAQIYSDTRYIQYKLNRKIVE